MNPHLIVRIAGGLLALVIAPAVFVYLVTTEHEITYGSSDGSYTVRCDPIGAADGEGWLFDHSGGPLDASAVEGEEVLDALKNEAREQGFELWYIQRALNKDCVDLRQTKMMWATAWATFGLAGLVVAARPMPSRRREERLPSDA